MPHSHAKVLLQSVPPKLNFVMVKLYQKILHSIVATNALAGSHIVTHSNAALFLIKLTTFCLAKNIKN